MLAVATAAPLAIAAAELPVAPEHGVPARAYARVDRADGSFRRMLALLPDGAEVASGLPVGTVLLMETWYAPAAPAIVYVRRKTEAGWRYGSFAPGEPDLATGPSASCAGCHRRAEHDGTFTLPLLARALATGRPQAAGCDRPGRTPCPPATYEGG